MDVAAELEGFIRGNFFYDGPALAPDTSLMESGILDSTGVLELVGFLEERFGFKVEDADLTPENLDRWVADCTPGPLRVEFPRFSFSTTNSLRGTLQSMGVMLAGLVLGPKRGAAAVLVVLALVAIGLPVLAGGRGGIGG